MDIEVTLDDLKGKLRTAGNGNRILETADDLLNKVRGKWQPSAAGQWYEFQYDTRRDIGRILTAAGEYHHLNLDHSLTFLKPARLVMAFAYTIGHDMDKIAEDMTAGGEMLKAYILDLIGLAALEKTCRCLTKEAEILAETLGWGVSPFLSPGSVHGWELEEQNQFCELLPLNEIGVTLGAHSVLSPLKSIAALVGIGPGYDRVTVGSTCEVCTNRGRCTMAQAIP